MKKTLTLCASLCSVLLLTAMMLPMTAQADNISVETARSLAKKFLTSNSDKRKANSASNTTLTLSAELSDCYLFNRGSGNGFVIVASDDAVAEPILGYSDSGSLDATTMPCNLRWWLSQYEQEMAYAQENATASASAKARVAKAPVVSKAAIEPLVQSHWNQSSPYNNLCPTVSGNATYTGCVATATAQIMRYHQWPEKGTGSVSYAWNSQTLSRDFSQSTYDWDNMLLSYGSGYTSAQGEAVARLMVDVGYSVSMSYGTSGSGAVASYVARALPKYFGYSSQIKNLSRSDYGLTDWTNLLYSELADGRPILYSGQSSTSGHAFVVDGYRQGYFHVNWGWGGMSDGYFLISSLDPDQQGIGGSTSGYNSGQEAIIGIEPGTGSEETVTEKPNIHISNLSISSPISRKSYIDIFESQIGITNKGMQDVTGCMGLKVVDESGNITYVAAKGSMTFKSGYTHHGTYNDIYLTNFPTDKTQTYKVYIVFKADGDDQWYDVSVDSGNDYLLATTDDSNIYFTPPSSKVITISATNITLPEKIFTGKTFTVKAKVSATGGEYNNKVYAYTDGSQIGVAPVDVDEKTSTTIAIDCTAPSTAGTYTLTLKDKDGNAVAEDVSYTVDNTPSGSLAISLSEAVFTSTTQDNLHVKATFKCTSGYYNGTVTAWIFPENGGTSLSSLTGTINTWEGETTTADFKGSFGGTVGTTYAMLFMINNNWINGDYSDWEYFTLTDASSNTVTSFENIGELIDGAQTPTTAGKAKLGNTQVSFDADDNPATVVAVLKNDDSNSDAVEAGSIFIVDKSERGLMLIPSTSDSKKYDLSGLKVGDIITGQLAGNYAEKSGLPTLEVRSNVTNTTSGSVTYTSSISIDRSGEATETEEATYPVIEIPNIHFLAKTNEKDADGNANVGDVEKQAYGKYLNNIITVSGIISADKDQYYLLQNEDQTVDDADLYRIYLSADELPDIDLADYVGCTGTIEGLLIKRNLKEAKISALKKNYFVISKIYISEQDSETRIGNLVSNGALANDADVYLHRTKLVTTGDNAYATICLPFDMKESEFATAFGCHISTLAEATQTVSSDGVQQFASVSSKAISAGKPYLLKATGTQTLGNGTATTASNGTTTYDDNYWTHIGEKRISVATPEKVEASYSDNIVNGTFYFCGTYGKKQYTTGDDGKPTTTLIADNGSQKYQYISTTDGTLRYLPGTSTLAFNGLRAYYYFPNWDAAANNALAPSGSKNAKLLIAVDGDTVTTIDGVTLDGDAASAPIYNMSGQMVGNSRAALSKGVYVQNGRKFVIE